MLTAKSRVLNEPPPSRAFLRTDNHPFGFENSRCLGAARRALIGLWRRGTKKGKRCYELLRAAYIKARYSDFYKISNEELDWLTDRIRALKALTRRICEERLARDD